MVFTSFPPSLPSVPVVVSVSRRHRRACLWCSHSCFWRLQVCVSGCGIHVRECLGSPSFGALRRHPSRVVFVSIGDSAARSRSWLSGACLLQDTLSSPVPVHSLSQYCPSAGSTNLKISDVCKILLSNRICSFHLPPPHPTLFLMTLLCLYTYTIFRLEAIGKREMEWPGLWRTWILFLTQGALRWVLLES